MKPLYLVFWFVFPDYLQEYCELEILQEKHIFGNVSNSSSISFTQKTGERICTNTKKISIQSKADQIKLNFGKPSNERVRVSMSRELEIMDITLIFSCTRSSPPGVTNSAATLTPRRTSANKIRELRTLSCRYVPLSVKRQRVNCAKI